MTTKQVKASAKQTSPQAKTEHVAALAEHANEQLSATTKRPNRNLFVKVDTFNGEGREVGTRIVDMYHFGTRNWMQEHHWWAMHNGHTVEVKTAAEEEVSTYLTAQKAALAAKFAKEQAHTA